MSDPSDDTNGASSSASRARASGGMGGAKGDLARLRSARASSGVNRAEVRSNHDIYIKTIFWSLFPLEISVKKMILSRNHDFELQFVKFRKLTFLLLIPAFKSGR